ncbi:MAG: response regulator [Fretibacterium sp.]|nr:response regulator [Fretibacterium sp.]
MINRLTAVLKEMEIEAILVEPNADKISAEKDKAEVIVFFTGDFVYNSPGFLSYLWDMCLEEDKPLCIVGYDKERLKVKETIPGKVIVREVARPFDVKALASQISSLLKMENKLSVEKQILLVDDDYTFLQIVRSWLGLKYNVTVARSGMQGITYIAEHQVDLILLDYDMPIMNGPQVLEALRSEPTTAHIPVIFLTGKNDRDSVMSVMSLKPDGYLLKSMSREDIIASVDNFFRTKKWQNLSQNA